MAFRLGMTVDLCMTYMIMFVSKSQWVEKDTQSALNYFEN